MGYVVQMGDMGLSMGQILSLPLGAEGDFTTAPEISQMFGEMIGLWLAQVWMDQGAPGEFALVELGPGRGTLMADALRATARVPGFHAGLRLHLVEASPALRARQEAALQGHEVTFHDHPASLPDLPTYLIANEFFDALPIRQFQRAKIGWHERMIIVEWNASAQALAADFGNRIEALGGAALILDYGDEVSIGDTLQAVRGHAPVDALASPGAVDLTAHVAFGPLASASRARASRLTPQGVFLERLGITARAEALAAKLQGAALDSHIAAHRRLTHPSEMGTLFKVLALTPTHCPAPPGLEPA